jgi:hypothetical protein
MGYDMEAGDQLLSNGLIRKKEKRLRYHSSNVWRSKNSLDYKGQVWWYTPVISDT